MKKTAKANKTTAAAEKAAREARNSGKPARKSKAAREAAEQVRALTGANDGAEAAGEGQAAQVESREAEVARAAEMGVTLAENEYLTRPENLPEGATVKKVVRRDGQKLPEPIYKVEFPEAARQSAPEKRARKAKQDASPRKGWAEQSVEGERAQAVLKKLQKGTRQKPVFAAKELNDHERHLARRLFAHGLIRRDKFEQGIGYFA
jgi:hypothetical protein